MSYGAATSRLRKSLLFSMAQRLGEDVCYRCGLKIENENVFSIEHKESWLYSDNPIKMFFSLENISFSHISCNVRASIRPTKVYNSSLEKKRAETKRYWANPAWVEHTNDLRRTRYAKGDNPNRRAKSSKMF